MFNPLELDGELLLKLPFKTPKLPHHISSGLFSNSEASPKLTKQS